MHAYIHTYIRTYIHTYIHTYIDFLRMVSEKCFCVKDDLMLLLFSPEEGSGPFLEVLQDQANPWRSRSKLLHLLLSSKISLISMAPSGDRIRY